MGDPARYAYTRDAQQWKKSRRVLRHLCDRPDQALFGNHCADSMQCRSFAQTHS
jgi:hypothetical protein